MSEPGEVRKPLIMSEPRESRNPIKTSEIAALSSRVLSSLRILKPVKRTGWRETMIESLAIAMFITAIISAIRAVKMLRE